MQEIWTEQLAPLVVAAPDGGGGLTARIDVTGIARRPLQATLALGGELCVGTTSALAAEVERLLALGIDDIRFDLHDLRLCTSAGIDLWVDVAARLLQVGGDLRLDGASGVVRRALDAVQVTDSGTVRRDEHGWN